MSQESAVTNKIVNAVSKAVSKVVQEDITRISELVRQEESRERKRILKNIVWRGVYAPLLRPDDLLEGSSVVEYARKHGVKFKDLDKDFEYQHKIPRGTLMAKHTALIDYNEDVNSFLTKILPDKNFYLLDTAYTLLFCLQNMDAVKQVGKIRCCQWFTYMRGGYDNPDDYDFQSFFSVTEAGDLQWEFIEQGKFNHIESTVLIALPV